MKRARTRTCRFCLKTFPAGYAVEKHIRRDHRGEPGMECSGCKVIPGYHCGECFCCKGHAQGAGSGKRISTPKGYRKLLRELKRNERNNQVG